MTHPRPGDRAVEGDGRGAGCDDPAVRLLAVDLHRVRLPLVRPFRTSFGEQTVRDVLVLRAETDVGVGWGECAADVDPHYSPEFNDSARLALVDHLVPLLFAAGDDLSGAAVAEILEPVKGHRMAKEALEVAVLDAELRAAGVSLAEHLGGVRDAVDVGVSVGITDDPGVLAGWVAEYLDEGYRRIKLKIEPGADIERVAAIRELTGDGFPLQVDANTAYRVTDAEHLARLDEFDLLLVEQPLPEDDFVGHADPRPTADHARSAWTSRSSRSPTSRRPWPWGPAASSTSSPAGSAACSRPGASTTAASPRTSPSGAAGCWRPGSGGPHWWPCRRSPASRCPATRRPRTATTPPT